MKVGDFFRNLSHNFQKTKLGRNLNFKYQKAKYNLTNQINLNDEKKYIFETPEKINRDISLREILSAGVSKAETHSEETKSEEPKSNTREIFESYLKEEKIVNKVLDEKDLLLLEMGLLKFSSEVDVDTFFKILWNLDILIKEKDKKELSKYLIGVYKSKYENEKIIDDYIANRDKIKKQFSNTASDKNHTISQLKAHIYDLRTIEKYQISREDVLEWFNSVKNLITIEEENEILQSIDTIYCKSKEIIDVEPNVEPEVDENKIKYNVKTIYKKYPQENIHFHLNKSLKKLDVSVKISNKNLTQEEKNIDDQENTDIMNDTPVNSNDINAENTSKQSVSEPQKKLEDMTIFERIEKRETEELFSQNEKIAKLKEEQESVSLIISEMMKKYNEKLNEISSILVEKENKKSQVIQHDKIAKFYPNNLVFKNNRDNAVNEYLNLQKREKEEIEKLESIKSEIMLQNQNLEQINLEIASIERKIELFTRQTQDLRKKCLFYNEALSDYKVLAKEVLDESFIKREANKTIQDLYKEKKELENLCKKIEEEYKSFYEEVCEENLSNLALYNGIDMSEELKPYKERIAIIRRELKIKVQQFEYISEVQGEKSKNANQLKEYLESLGRAIVLGMESIENSDVRRKVL